MKPATVTAIKPVATRPCILCETPIPVLRYSQVTSKLKLWICDPCLERKTKTATAIKL